MKIDLEYICRKCGEVNKITSFWKWFWTPHFGAKKWLSCIHCESKRHFMTRKGWTGPWWLDWPKNK
jgi:DNA-directed RNA polymerase subunit RPC12/RpoP